MELEQGEERYVGRSVKRREDQELLTGVARFVADLRLPETAHVVFVRSTIARGRIRSLALDDARNTPGVIATVTGKAISQEVHPLSRYMDQEALPRAVEEAASPVVQPCPMPVLPEEEVDYVGQPLVAVVARTEAIARDAAEKVVVECEELPPVLDPFWAAGPEAPVLHAEMKSNVQAGFAVTVGDPEKAFGEAECTLSAQLTTPRVAAAPMETRGVLAVYSSSLGELTLWSSTQTPHWVRTRVAHSLDMEEARIRVVAPAVGGGFGPKCNSYPEEILISHLARRLDRPVQWIESRSEHMVGTFHSRDQIHNVRVAFTRSGKVTALATDFVMDCGAFNPFSITCAYNTVAHLRGVYQIPAYSARCRCVLTNKTPNVPYRGAGRPEGAWVVERVLNAVAQRLQLDAVDVLRANLIPADDVERPRGLPYRDGNPVTYDCGDFSEGLDYVVRASGYEGHRKLARASGDGRRRGIGFASFTEGTGIGPFEAARVSVNASGGVVVQAGCSPHGQGHVTMLSQIVADEFGIEPADVQVQVGDTAAVPRGVGTFASRSAVAAGSATATAAARLRDKIKVLAGELLEAAPEDIVVHGHRAAVRGMPHRAVTLEDLVPAASPQSVSRLPLDIEPGLEVLYHFVPPTVTWGYGFMAAIVDVDTETGDVDIDRLIFCHDCGRMINPMIVEGQIHGGVLQGVGAALYEEFSYGDDGQPLSTTFIDYQIPSIGESSPIQSEHIHGVSQRNPLGVRGIGEAGVICPPPAIANAVVDALAPLPVTFDRPPLTPMSVVRAIEEAKEAGGSRLGAVEEHRVGEGEG